MLPARRHNSLRSISVEAAWQTRRHVAGKHSSVLTSTFVRGLSMVYVRFGSLRIARDCQRVVKPRSSL